MRIPSSKNLIAAVTIAAFGLTAGATFAQAADNGAHQGASSHAAADHRPASKKSVRQLTAQVKKEVKEMKEANAKLKRAQSRLASTTHALHQERAKELRVASAERNVKKGTHKQSSRMKPPAHRQPPNSNPPR